MLGFSRLCYYLVKTGNIKISAVLSTNNDTGVNTLSFPELGDVCIDMDRAETFGLMTVRAKLQNNIINISHQLQISNQYIILQCLSNRLVRMATDLNANFDIYLLRSIWLHFMFTLLVIRWKVRKFRVNKKPIYWHIIVDIIYH